MISSAYEIERRNSGKKQRPAQDSVAGRFLVLLETGETIQSSALDVTPRKFTLAIRRLHVFLFVTVGHLLFNKKITRP